MRARNFEAIARALERPPHKSEHTVVIRRPIPHFLHDRISILVPVHAHCYICAQTDMATRPQTVYTANTRATQRPLDAPTLASTANAPPALQCRWFWRPATQHSVEIATIMMSATVREQLAALS